MTSSQENDSGIHLAYKNLGETPLQCLGRWKTENPDFIDSNLTYAGRLDPMAEGLIILLSGERLMQKEKYLDLTKTYEAEILWGFETDTLDILGKVTKFESYKVESELEIQAYFNKSVGKIEQKYPAYSSKPVNGKPLFQWAREGRISEIMVPKHEVELFSCEYLSRRTILKEELVREIFTKVNLVKGDFRQKEILEKWKEVLDCSESEEFVIDRIELKVSSGFYVRQFVSDMAEQFGKNATTFFIKRVQIGEYTIADSLKK